MGTPNYVAYGYAVVLCLRSQFQNHVTIMLLREINTSSIDRLNMKKSLLVIIVSLFLAVFLVGQVYGWNIEYVIEPNHEATEIIPLTPSSSVIGNVSATGSIFFYVSSPSSNIVYCSNETTFTPFSFTASEVGNYTLHIINVNRTENVVATLIYSKNLVLTLYSTITMKFNTETTTTTNVIVKPTTSFDWVGFLNLLAMIYTIGGFVIGVIKTIKKLVRRLRWKKKYGKPQSPSPYVIIQS